MLTDSEAKINTFRTYYDALGIFKEPSLKNSDFTKAGEILHNNLKIEAEECKKILWITPEIKLADSKEELYKASRARAVPVLRRNIQKVENFHLPFFKNLTAWEKETENWITLTQIMKSWREDFTYKDYPVEYFILIFDSEELGEFRSCKEYQDGEMVIIYPKISTEYKLIYSRIDPINVDKVYGKGIKNISHEIEWLRKFETERLYAYVGYHYPKTDLENICLWAAFEKGITTRSIFKVKHFSGLMHGYYSKQINESVSMSIDLHFFWEKTKNLNPHNKKKRSELIEHFRHFIGLTIDDPWPPFGLTEKNIIDCLKTMSGYSFSKKRSTDSISMLGIFFVFLCAAAAKNISQSIKFNVNVKEIDKNNLARYGSPFPEQKKATEKETILALYDMFSKLITHEIDDRSLVEMVRLDEKGLEIIIDLDANKKYKNERPSLYQSLIHCIMKSSGLDLDEDQKFGNSSESIINFWLMTNLRDSIKPIEKHIFFPYERRVVFIYSEKKLAIHFPFRKKVPKKESSSK